MDISLFLAKAFGLYFVIISISMIMKKEIYRSLIFSIANNPATMLLIGIFTLILGILLILNHNIWQANWRIIITILAWLTFISGIFRVWFPEIALKIGKKLIVNNLFYSFNTVLSLVLGIILGYFGFFHG